MKVPIESIQANYKIAKDVFHKKIDKHQGLDYLEKNYGLNRGSATQGINQFKAYIEGKEYVMGGSILATKYYLNQIHKEYGLAQLKTALESFELHLSHKSSNGIPLQSHRELLEAFRKMIEDMGPEKTLYIDMDNVLVDFRSSFPRVDQKLLKKYKHDKDEIPGIFSLMDPMLGAIETITILSQYFDIYFLSTAPWDNPSAWHDKLLWIKKHLPEIGYKRLILSHHKNLNKGDYIVDDRTKRGVDKFEGEHIHFGEDGNFKTWQEVIQYLIKKEEIQIEE